MHQGCIRSRQRRREGSGGVVADIAKLSVGREEYYTRELATDHEQYLSGHGESPGRWYGAGARGLGLRGEASVAEFQAMFEGRHPNTGEFLGRPHGRNAVPAFDVVLRPTKSVSILYGLGDPAIGRAVLAAHHAGLAEAVGYLDEHLGGRRGHGGVQQRPGPLGQGGHPGRARRVGPAAPQHTSHPPGGAGARTGRRRGPPSSDPLPGCRLTAGTSRQATAAPAAVMGDWWNA
jgi:TrwC relaxase